MMIRERAIVEKYFDIQAISFACGMLTSYLLEDLSGNIGYFILKVGLSLVGFGIAIFIIDRYMQ